MPIKYEIVEDVYGETIKRTNKDGSETWIPKDPSNSDYQAYLEQQANAEKGTLS